MDTTHYSLYVYLKTTLFRRVLGVRREMMLTGIRRLTPSRSDIEGWPPLVLTLQHPQVYFFKEENIYCIDVKTFDFQVIKFGLHGCDFVCVCVCVCVRVCACVCVCVCVCV